MAWVLCREGCGLHHRDDDVQPLHDMRWLESERRRLLIVVGMLHAARHDLQARLDSRYVAAQPDDLALARARRDGTPIAIETRASVDGGVVLDVDLGKPPRSER